MDAFAPGPLTFQAACRLLEWLRSARGSRSGCLPEDGEPLSSGPAGERAVAMQDSPATGWLDQRGVPAAVRSCGRAIRVGNPLQPTQRHNRAAVLTRCSASPKRPHPSASRLPNVRHHRLKRKSPDQRRPRHRFLQRAMSCSGMCRPARLEYRRACREHRRHRNDALCAPEKNTQPHAVDVFLNRRAHDHLRRLPKACK